MFTPGFQYACFVLAAMLSASLLLAIKVSVFMPHATHFAILRWVCKKALVCGMSGREWILFPVCVGIFGIVGTLLTILGIPFPYSFYISFIVACFWILYKQRV